MSRRCAETLTFPIWRLVMHRARCNRFLPRLEILEDRSIPSTFTFNAATATLTVTGTVGKDATVITDDGSNNAGAVTVTNNGATLFTSGPTAGDATNRNIGLDPDAVV